MGVDGLAQRQGGRMSHHAILGSFLLCILLICKGLGFSWVDGSPPAVAAAGEVGVDGQDGAESGETAPLQTRTGGPGATVFGYLPYWEKTAALRYDLLTHVACFSVGANADGSISNSHGWPWTSVISAAHQNGVKVILVVTQFDPDTALALITHAAAKSHFFVNLKALMLAGQSDGVNIDFEGSGTYRSHINGFMADLTTYLHAEVPGSEVTFAGPAVNWGGGWDLAGLANSCDGIFIMGYDFYGSWSTTSGPCAPLTGGSYNITNTVYTQYKEVTQNNPQKLILGVPYFGKHWTTATSDPRSAVTAYIGSAFYSSAQAQAETYGLLWDAASQTPWYRYHDGADWHQVWFDNADSIRLKFQLAKNAGLQGVGIWALGYDAGRTELWNVIRDEFVLAYRPDLDATLIAQSFPPTLTCGETAEVWVEYTNIGGKAWSQGSVNLGTWNPQDRASSFYTEGDWIGSTRPTGMDTAACEPDGSCRFSFMMTAPATAGVYNESWRLVKEGTAWFGDETATFQITVLPRPIPGDFDEDRDVDMEDFAFLQKCLSGSGVTPSAACEAGDLSGDDDVDGQDALLLKSCMSGSGIEGDPDCL